MKLTATELAVLLPRLKRRAQRLTHDPNEAEDLAQEAALRVLQKLQAGTQIDNPEHYAMTTLRHLTASNWRGRNATVALEDDTPDISMDPSARLFCQDVRAAIARLPEEQRHLMTRVYAGQTSPKDLARETGLPVGTVMSRLSRARMTLRHDVGLERHETVQSVL